MVVGECEHTYMVLKRRMVGERRGGKSALVSIRPESTERPMSMRPSATRQGGRLTSADLMAVRKGIPGFLGNHGCKGWEGRRMRPAESGAL